MYRKNTINLILFVGTTLASMLYFLRPSTPIESPIATPTIPTPSPSPSPTPPAIVSHPVPFTPQAPLGEWHDPLQQDGCEEAAVIMAMAWANDQALSDKGANKQKILDLASWQQTAYGSAIDTSAEDTTKRLIYEYFKHQNAYTKNIEKPQEIIDYLANGNIIIAPMDGQKLQNPNFTPPGPERHMVVISGYDITQNVFITQDPGTRSGKNYHYDMQVVFNAIRNYPTGKHLPILQGDKTVIVIAKP